MSFWPGRIHDKDIGGFSANDIDYDCDSTQYTKINYISNWPKWLIPNVIGTTNIRLKKKLKKHLFHSLTLTLGEHKSQGKHPGAVWESVAGNRWLTGLNCGQKNLKSEDIVRALSKYPEAKEPEPQMLRTPVAV